MTTSEKSGGRRGYNPHRSSASIFKGSRNEETPQLVCCIDRRIVRDAAENDVRCDCSGFVSLLFEYVYGYTQDGMKKWFDQDRKMLGSTSA